MATTEPAFYFFFSRLVNATSSAGKLLVPSLALAATAFFSHTMAFTQAIPQLTPAASSSSSALSGHSVTASPASRLLQSEIATHAQRVHLVVLIHGWLGSPSEMASIQEALEVEIDQANSNEIVGGGRFDDNQSDESVPPVKERSTVEGKERRIIPVDTAIVIHSVVSNDGKTHDGIFAGGCRVADEVNSLIKDILSGADNNSDESGCRKNVYLSFIGNSLGGLYARSAIASIEWDLPNGDQVKPCIFCTTATPHLGKRGQTYVRLPRLAEQGIGYALKPTGQDLFGLNKVIENLATQAKYLNPLLRFQKRIAYANAYGTDLQVPTATAAFLADTESKHYTKEIKPPFLLTVTTPRDENVLASIAQATDSSSSPHIPASTMARTLDALGWTKVFCDVRDKLVSVPIPFRDEASSEFKAKDEWTSHELKSVVASRIVRDKKWPIPFGHTMLIANSKSELYAKMNQGGKPFVRQLASDFIDDLLQCHKGGEGS